MVLSVLSGEKPVTQAIAELGISRPLYYQLESKALIAMLSALAPGASSSSSPDEATPAARVAELEERISALEQDKRRLERLLFLTRKVLPPGPVTMPGKRGRPRRDSRSDGLERSPRSTSTNNATKTSASPNSTSKPDGVQIP